MAPTDAITQLHTLPLPHPLLLLPAARVTIPISAAAVDDLLDLIDSSDPATVAVVPLVRPSGTTLHEWGVSAHIVRLVRPTRPSTQPYLLSVQGVARIRLASSHAVSVNNRESLPKLTYSEPSPDADGAPSREVIAAFRSAALRLLDRLAKDSVQPRRKEGWLKIVSLVEETSDDRMGWLADTLVSAVNGEYNDKLDFLSAYAVPARLQRATTLFIKQTSIAEVSTKVASSLNESFSNQQKEIFLRQQRAAIDAELRNLQKGSPRPRDAADASSGDISELDADAEGEDELAEVKRRIEAMEHGSEERRVGVAEWRRLKRIPQQSAEYGVVRSYLEWLTSLPWPGVSLPAAGASAEPSKLSTREFLANAQQQLDADHFGLDRVKRRLIEYLAVVRLREMQAAAANEAQEAAATPAADEKALVKYDGKASAPRAVKRRTKGRGVKGPILLFVGPPGTGKTSLGQSIARALDRPFQRIALGGVRDEGEIRGHRRTYVASGPGLIVQALRKAGRADPVIVLDEIDKVGQSNFHGDPAAALLEVLDPEQNHSFNDHYMNVPVDLSQVLFICTANSLDTIAAPLLDRCETVHLSGYTYDEKLHIARRFLLPKQLTANGLTPAQLELTEAALLGVVTHYTREAGVRSLERALGAVARFKAVEWAKRADAAADYRRTVDADELEPILGIARWDAADERERDARRGVVYGLVVTGMGEGEILPVETIAVPGSGRLRLTGSLGDVIKESGEIALSWVKRHAYELGVTAARAQDPLRVPDAIDVHLHLPAGAQKKDGPSAGVAMACAFVSLLTGACVPPNIAMTGEITLRGRVTPVGGIKEKVLGAHRAGMTKLVLPWANRKDVEHDVPPEVRRGMQFVFVRTVQEALEAAFGKGALGWRMGAVEMVESRL
ncbi:ATP-dependent protease La [Dentipellis sp. KUC8613]|nr:ATP-dependent protease La [Dentipellis sp. KUC8613]